MYSYEHTESLSTKMALFHRFYMLTVYKVLLFWPGAARGRGRLSCPVREGLGRWFSALKLANKVDMTCNLGHQKVTALST